VQTISRDTIMGIAINFPKAYQHILWAARRMTFRECVRMALRRDREQKRQAREQVLQSLQQRKQLDEVSQTAGSMNAISMSAIPVPVSLPQRSSSHPSGLSISIPSDAQPEGGKAKGPPEKTEHVYRYAVGDRVRHKDRGIGNVTEHMLDGRTVISFDSGETHRYKPSSMHKIELVMGAPVRPQDLETSGMFSSLSGYGLV